MKENNIIKNDLDLKDIFNEFNLDINSKLNLEEFKKIVLFKKDMDFNNTMNMLKIEDLNLENNEVRKKIKQDSL